MVGFELNRFETQVSRALALSLFLVSLARLEFESHYVVLCYFLVWSDCVSPTFIPTLVLHFVAMYVSPTCGADEGRNEVEVENRRYD